MSPLFLRLGPSNNKDSPSYVINVTIPKLINARAILCFLHNRWSFMIFFFVALQANPSWFIGVLELTACSCLVVSNSNNEYLLVCTRSHSLCL